MKILSPLEAALLSLEGLSVGDAFGQLFFSLPFTALENRRVPAGPWRWTDDTHMALSVVEVLRNYSEIHQDALACLFAERFMQEPSRGYAGGAQTLLEQIYRGEHWRKGSTELFSGGSYGNGAAMRAAPIGGFFAGDPERAASEAQRAAVITHAHPEGQAGAMAVAAAAALAGAPAHPSGMHLISEVLYFVPHGLTRTRIDRSLDIAADNIKEAVHELGTGSRVSAQDTVPYCLWCAAYHLDDFQDALWWTVRGLGDRDTTCAIVGGIVALSTRSVPAEWVAQREALPDGFQYSHV
jgi:ADP-ribosylglycohydrolase